MYKKSYKVVPTRDAFEVRQNVTETVVARCASQVRANRVKDELNGCDVLPEVVARGLVREAVEAIASPDRDIAIGEHAFKAGYAARAAEDVGPLSDAETAWSNYTPPEELCGGAL